jgi:hypothetical protein
VPATIAAVDLPEHVEGDALPGDGTELAIPEELVVADARVQRGT